MSPTSANTSGGKHSNSTITKNVFVFPDLVELSLWKISYISPQAMVNCLSALPKLKNFELEFHSPQPRSDQLPPPLPRISLPSLTSLRFQGVSEYLEDLVAQIDIPLLDQLSVTFFNQLIFDISQ